MATMNIYASGVSSSANWNNASNATGEYDGVYATTTLARNNTRTLTVTFTNSLPDGATINSITAYCRLYRSNTTALTTSTLDGTTVTIPTSIGNVSKSIGTTFPSSISLMLRTTQRNNLPTIYVDSFWLEVDYTVISFYYPVTYNKNITKTDLSTDSVILESTTGEYSTIYFQIKDVPYGSSKKIDFDYETNVSAFRLRVVDTVPDPDVDLFVKEYTNSTSGHVTLTFTNNGGGEKNVVTFTYNTSDIGTFTITNFTVTEYVPRLFPYEIVLISRMEETSTTETGATLITTEQDQQSDVYYKLPLEIGKSYKISFDYETNCGSFYISVRNRTLSPNYYLLEEQNIKDTLYGHLEYTFSNDYESAMDYASFGIKTFRNDVTFTFSNFTLTEITESGTNLIRLGSTQPTAFYLGTFQVQRIYLGINLIYEVP